MTQIREDTSEGRGDVPLSRPIPQTVPHFSFPFCGTRLPRPAETRTAGGSPAGIPQKQIQI